MGSVAVVGSSNIDLVIKSEHLPLAGETVLGGDFIQAFGGKGANQAVAAARAGAETSFIGKIGTDSFGTQMLKNLQADGIHTEGLGRSSSPSGVALIMVNGDGENIISVAPGANSDLTASDVERNRGILEAADIILLQLEIPLPAVYRAIDIASEAGVPIVLNPAPAPPEPFSPEHLAKVTCCIPNKGELGLLTGMQVISEDDIEKASSMLIDKGVSSVLVTLGGKGVFFLDKGERGIVPSIRVEPVDTVGAGDCFSGCLSASLAEGNNLQDAIRFAVAGAALSVTKLGAQPSLPRKDDILKLLG